MVRIIFIACLLWSLSVCSAASQEPKETKPRLDRHGDPLPAGAIARLGTGRLRQAGYGGALALTPDGKMLATVGEEAVRLWDTSTGRELRRLEGYVGGCTALVIGPTEKTLISAGGVYGVLRMWDTTNGQELRCFGGQGVRVTCLAMAPGRRTLWAGESNGTVRQWLLPAGIELRQLVGHKEQILAIGFAARGKQLLTAAADGTTRVWDPHNATEIRRFTIDQSTASALPPAAFSPDGQLLAYSGLNPRGIRLIDMEEGKPLRQLKANADIAASLAFSPSGKILAIADSSGVSLWGVASGKELRSISGPRSYRSGMAFSANGNVLAGPFGQQAIRLLDVVSGRDMLPTEGHQATIQSLFFSSDGRWVHSASGDQSVRLWDPATGMEIARVDNQPLYPLIIPGLTAGSFFAMTRDRVVQWELTENQFREVRRLEKGPAHSSAMAVSPDYKLLAVAAYDSFIWLVDSGTGAIKSKLGEAKADAGKRPRIAHVTHVAISPDGIHLAAARSGTGAVEFWNVKTGRLIRTFGQIRGAGSTRLAFSPNGQTLAVADTELRIYEVATGQERLKLPTLPRVFTIAFSPNGTVMVAALEKVGVQLIDAATGLPMNNQINHKGSAHALALSPDGKFLVTAGADTTALVWDAVALWKKDLPAPVQLLADEQDLLWKLLASDDAARAYQALWALVAARDQTVNFVKDRLRPAAKSINPKRIAEYIADLDHAKFDVRQKAERELESLGDDAEMEMKTALEGQLTLEQSTRLQRLLSKVKGPSPEKRRAIRALEVLEYIGTAQAREVLTGLAKGAPGHWQTEQAREALHRFSSRAN